MGTWATTYTVDDHEMSDPLDAPWTVPALRWVALVETFSFVVLMAFVVLDNRAAVRVVGMTHGLLFLAYLALVLAVRRSQDWSWGFAALAIVGGPIGALIVPPRLREAAASPTREVARV